MPWYKLYAGLTFDNGRYQETAEFNSEEEALEAARDCAIEEYQSYEGYHGILSPQDCREDLAKSFYNGDINAVPDDEVEEHYLEEIESWIYYDVKPATGPDDVEEY